MNTKLMFSSKSELWATPQTFFDKLNEEFHFTLDPCATAENAKCERYFTAQEDGLSQDWGGQTVFCNPPYCKKNCTVDCEGISGIAEAWDNRRYATAFQNGFRMVS